jgi:hypothetical protein
MKTLNIVERIDTCVHCFRKSNYLNEKLLWKCITLEWEEAVDDGYILYRGTNNLWDENPTILTRTSHSSFPILFSIFFVFFSNVLVCISKMMEVDSFRTLSHLEVVCFLVFFTTKLPSRTITS